jgi:hypothetical protein
MKLTPEKKLIIEKVAKAFQLVSSDDKDTIITRKMAGDAIPTLVELKDKIISLFPKENSKTIRSELNPKKSLTVLREILKYKSSKLLSMRTVTWDTANKRQKQVFTYRVVS